MARRFPIAKKLGRIATFPLRLLASPFRLKGLARDRFVLCVIVVVTIAAAIVDYPKAWNNAGGWLDPKIDTALGWIGDRTGAESFHRAAQNFDIPDFPEKIFGRFVKEFALGLDLSGGIQMIYEADVSKIEQQDISQAMQSLRDIIEQRVNFFGVREPVVELEESPGKHRIIVELAGIQDPAQAIAIVQQAPFLEFKEEDPSAQTRGEELNIASLAAQFKSTGLTGRYLKRADVTFDQTTGQPQVSLQFNDEGGKLFADITRRNIQKQVGIFLDGFPVSLPTVQQEIPSGQAVITGSFTIDEAKALVRNLNAGALPVPITLIAQQSVGASLGQDSLNRIILAGLVAFGLVVAFMVFMYRIPGVLASFALLIYAALALAIFKLLPVTLTVPGIAGFVLSIGMAVDANILIFARMREERAWGKEFKDAVEEGFRRAWTSIFDSNMSTILTTAILYLVGTSFVRGFALALGVGVAVSMFSAIFVSRLILRQVVRLPLPHHKWLW